MAGYKEFSHDELDSVLNPVGSMKKDVDPSQVYLDRPLEPVAKAVEPAAKTKVETKSTGVAPPAVGAPMPNLDGSSLVQDVASGFKQLQQSVAPPKAPNVIKTVGGQISDVLDPIKDYWPLLTLPVAAYAVNKLLGGEKESTTGGKTLKDRMFGPSTETERIDPKMYESQVRPSEPFLEPEAGSKAAMEQPKGLSAQEQELIARSEQNRLANEAAAKEKAAKEAAAKAPEKAVSPEAALTKQQQGMKNYLVSQYGGGAEGEAAYGKVKEILGHTPEFPKGVGGGLSPEETSVIKEWRKVNMEGPKINLTHGMKKAMTSGAGVAALMALPGFAEAAQRRDFGKMTDIATDFFVLPFAQSRELGENEQYELAKRRYEGMVGGGRGITPAQAYNVGAGRGIAPPSAYPR